MTQKQAPVKTTSMISTSSKTKTVWRVVESSGNYTDFEDKAEASAFFTTHDAVSCNAVQVRPYENLRSKARRIRKAKQELVFATLDEISKAPEDVELILKASGVGSSAVLKKAKSSNILIPPAVEKKLLSLKRVSPTWMNRAEKQNPAKKR